LDPGPQELAELAVLRPKAHPDELSRDLEILDAAVGLEGAAERVVVDAEDEEVRVLRLEPEQLVANRAADEVRVEPERADVVLDLLEPLRGLRRLRSRRAHRPPAPPRSSSGRACSRPRVARKPRSLPGSPRSW